MTLRKAFLALLLAMLGMSAHAQLAVTYGSKGPQTISYNGVTLHDAGANPNDLFHIWHMVTENASGTQTAGWGETATSEAFNSTTNTETYTFPWGTLAVQFAVSGANLNMAVTVTNTAGSGVYFDGAEIYPFALHFPSDPFGGYSQWKVTTSGPGLSVADYGTGIATAVIPSATIPTYGGWKNVTSQNSDSSTAYSPVMSTTLPDGASNFPQIAWKLAPGQTGSYTASVRFTAEGTPANTQDMATNYAQTYPATVSWANHNPIGTVYFATSTSGANIGGDGNASNPAGCGGSSANPRNYKDASGSVTCSVSKLSTAFQDQMLQDVRNTISNTKAFGGQGVIFWDIEGEEYSQPVTYVGSPDQPSPEFEQTINTTTSANSAYVGMKLDDAMVAMVRAAGLTPGWCFRPNQFIQYTSATADPNNSSITLPAGSAVQVFPTSTAQATTWLENKFAYVKQRWDASNQGFIAYIDSMVDANGMPLSPDVLKQANTDYPKVLMSPEAQNGGNSPNSSTPTTTTASIGMPLRYIAYSAPFYSFIFHTDVGTPAQMPGQSIYQTYPNAFGLNLINDVDPTALSNFTPKLTAAVSKGDILLAHGDYVQQNNATVDNINTSAGYQAPTAAQATCTPANGNKCWYVRADGGTRWSSARASNNISAQCNGQADVSYAAAFAAAGSPSTIPSGGLSCAFNDLRFMWDDAVTYNSISSVMSGGDTLIIGDTTNAYQSGENAWRVGYDRNPSTGAPITNAYPVWCRGIGYCYMAPFPTGTAANPTHIWGRNKGSCSVGNAVDKTKLTRIAGGEGSGADFTGNGATLDIQCLELLPEHSTMAGRGQVCAGGSTDHGFTSPNGAPPLPNCNSHPEYDFSSQGLTLSNTSNVTFTDGWIHNHNDSGIKGPFANLSLERVIIESNDSAGINTDNGCDSSATEPNTTSCMSNVMPTGATFSMDHSLITGSGCMHTVPYTGETGWQECADQSHGGYGDGIGTAACLQSYPDGTCHYGQHPNVSITNSILRYNVQDGEDFGHVDGDDGQILNFTFKNTLSYGNGGGQIKFGWGYDRLTITNNLLLANCARIAYPFSGQSSTFFNPMAAAGQDIGLCRGHDLFSFNVNNQTIATIDHNTFAGYAPTFFDYKCVLIEQIGGTGSSPELNCDNSQITFRNNLMLGYTSYDFLNAPGGGAYNGHTTPSTFCGASCNVSQNNGNDGGLLGTWNSSNNTYYGLRDNPANYARPDTKAGTSVNERNIDPLLKNEPLAGSTSRVIDAVDAMLDNFAFDLAPNSPAIATGITVSGETTDYTGASFASTPAIGGMEYGSTATAVVPLNTVTSVSVPVASPAPGTITAPTNLTLTCPSGFSGCSIYYTTDGFTTPTTSSTLYTGPISISKSTTVKAIAVASGYSNSAVSTFQYTINAVVNLLLHLGGAIKGLAAGSHL